MIHETGCSRARAWRALPFLLLLPPFGILTRQAQAQDGEFVRQVLLIANLDSPDPELGRKAGDALRDEVDDLYGRKELQVVSGSEIRTTLVESSFDPDTALNISDLKVLGRKFRADEYVLGTATRTAEGVRIEARLVLMRDDRLAQPLPVATARDIDGAARLVARSIDAARRQITPQRRCENHAMRAEFKQAVAAARSGIAAYPDGTLARLCLLTLYTQIGASRDSVLALAGEILERDSTNEMALEAAAYNHDRLGNVERAGALWERLAATSPDDAELIERVVAAMARGGNSRRAEPIVAAAVARFEGRTELLRLQFLVLLRNGRWAEASRVGEAVVAADPAATSDPRFVERMAVAYREQELPARALEWSARGAASFPDDAELYVLYTQLVSAEAAAVLPRGLAKFPENAALRAISARQLRERGQLAEALEATRAAIAANPRLPRGLLQVAQLQLELGQADSALASLEQALANGEDSALVAQYALARGSAMYREANGTKSRDDFVRARAFLSLADRAGPSAQAKFLVGAAAFSVGQSAATEAPTSKSCELSRIAEQSLVEAQVNLQSGAEVSPDAVQQYLGYLEQLKPYVTRQIETFCADE